MGKVEVKIHVKVEDKVKRKVGDIVKDEFVRKCRGQNSWEI